MVGWHCCWTAKFNQFFSIDLFPKQLLLGLLFWCSILGLLARMLTCHQTDCHTKITIAMPFASIAESLSLTWWVRERTWGQLVSDRLLCQLPRHHPNCHCHGSCRHQKGQHCCQLQNLQQHDERERSITADEISQNQVFLCCILAEAQNFGLLSFRV